MAIEFESPKPIVQMQTVLKTVAQEYDALEVALLSMSTSMRSRGITLSLCILP